MRYLSLLFFFIASTTVFANPDVFFTDSDNYGGAYLKHELHGTTVRFLFSQDVPGYRLPDEFFSMDKLVMLLDSGGYQFANQALKAEFVRMLRTSFESQFTLKEFIEELLRFLNHAKNAPDPTHGGGGCSTTESSSSTSTMMLALMACLMLARRQRARS